MKIEGALTRRFPRHDGIYRSDVSFLLFYPRGVSRFPVGPLPGYRTSRKEHALPIVRDEFRPAIPRRVARQRCPSPLHRQPQHRPFPPPRGNDYDRTVSSVLTVCLTKRGNPRAHLLIDVGLRHVAEKVLIKVNQQLLSMLPHNRSLETKPNKKPNCVSRCEQRNCNSMKTW